MIVAAMRSILSFILMMVVIAFHILSVTPSCGFLFHLGNPFVRCFDKRQCLVDSGICLRGNSRKVDQFLGVFVLTLLGRALEWYYLLAPGDVMKAIAIEKSRSPKTVTVKLDPSDRD